MIFFRKVGGVLNSVLFFLIFNFFSYSTIFSQTNFSIKIDHINYEYFYSEIEEGLATITYDTGNDSKYMSIGAFDLQNYKFGIIVDNVYLPINQEEGSTHSVSVTFNLGSIDGQTNTTGYPSEIVVQCHLFDSPTPPAPTTPLYPPETLVYAETIPVTEIVDNAIGIEKSINNIFDVSTVFTHTNNDGETRSVYKTNMPNLDLDASTNNMSWNGSGDLRACVPTATANSLKYLEKEYESISLEQESLRDCMEWMSLFMDRDHEKGVAREDHIEGILNYIENFNLPIEVKFQSNETNDDIISLSEESKAINRNDWSFIGIPKPTWEFLMQMMEEKEDVTICYAWKNPTGSSTPGGAHAVCLSGAKEYSSGVKKISFKHDTNQRTAGGIINQHEKINLNSDGAMVFGPGNKREIYFVIAKSPIVEEGQSEEGLLNEFFGLFGSGKISGIHSNNDFIEVALYKDNIDLNDYRLTFYDGTSGTIYQTLTVDQFTKGVTINNRTYYYYIMPANTLHSSPAGICISYTGTVLPGQFISYGGSFKAIEGDATGLLSKNIGNIIQGESFALVGNGTKCSDFTWSNQSSHTPGDTNPGQTYTLDTHNANIIPIDFSINQNYPNPFNPSTIIEYIIPHESYVNITIYDMLGRVITQLESAKKTSGTHTIKWNGLDQQGNPVPAGIYFYQLKAGSFVQNNKMVLVK